MTISSSLAAGVAGLNANATRLATISDNIANSATYGYKRAVADFGAMVTQGNAATIYSAGGVRVTTARMIDANGTLITTSNATDISINGRGFLPVTSATALDRPDEGFPVELTSTGSFRPDQNGILRTLTGQVLMGWPANPDGTIDAFPRDSMVGLQPVWINSNEYAGNPTTELTLGVNLPATSTAAGSDGQPYDLGVEYYSNLGTVSTLNITFAPVVPATGASNEWTMTITDSASDGAVVGEYVLTFDVSRANGGKLAGVTAVTGEAYDPATGAIGIAVADGPLRISLGTLGSASGMTQLADSFAPTSITKNGSPVAKLTGVEIDPNGNLMAVYDQGFSRRIYQIPVVDVPNPNGLIAMSNQTFQISPTSGAFYLWNAGEGPAGTTVGFSREESATDVAAELTQLIQTQRAYSSNAKVIQTVDEMLQETTNLKR